MSTWGALNDEARRVIHGRAVESFEIAERVTRSPDGTVLFQPAMGTSSPLLLLRREMDAAAPGRAVALIDPLDFDREPHITAEDDAAAQPIDAALADLSEYFGVDPLEVEEGEGAAASPLPAEVDNRSLQSPVKSQGGRNTCVSHASLALLESAGHLPDDLSEQFAHYKFNEFLGRPQEVDAGLLTTDAAPFLARDDGRVCVEAEWPYLADHSQIAASVASGRYGPPAEALANQTYGFRSYKIIPDHGLEAESIKNTRYLESLIALGMPVVVGAWVSWDDARNSEVIPLVIDPDTGEPHKTGGHAMLLVGYNRTEQYFIVKNSWGEGWGHAGYGLFQYDFVRACLKYGYTVSEFEPPVH